MSTLNDCFTCGASEFTGKKSFQSLNDIISERHRILQQNETLERVNSVHLCITIGSVSTCWTQISSELHNFNRGSAQLRQMFLTLFVLPERCRPPSCSSPLQPGHPGHRKQPSEPPSLDYLKPSSQRCQQPGEEYTSKNSSNLSWQVSTFPNSNTEVSVSRLMIILCCYRTDGNITG